MEKSNAKSFFPPMVMDQNSFILICVSWENSRIFSFFFLVKKNVILTNSEKRAFNQKVLYICTQKTNMYITSIQDTEVVLKVMPIRSQFFYLQHETYATCLVFILLFKIVSLCGNAPNMSNLLWKKKHFWRIYSQTSDSIFHFAWIIEAPSHEGFFQPNMWIFKGTGSKL